MAEKYLVDVRVGRQEDGLWRAEVPELQGCFVDAPTLAEVIAGLQEVVAIALDEYGEEGWPLPPAVTPLVGQPKKAVLPILVTEHRFTRSKHRTR